MSNLTKCTVLNAISHKGERVERGTILMLTADEVSRYQGHIQVESEDVTVAEKSAPVEPSNETAPADEDKKPSRLSLRKRK